MLAYLRLRTCTAVRAPTAPSVINARRASNADMGEAVIGASAVSGTGLPPCVPSPGGLPGEVPSPSCVFRNVHVTLALASSVIVAVAESASPVPPVEQVMLVSVQPFTSVSVTEYVPASRSAKVQSLGRVASPSSSREKSERRSPARREPEVLGGVRVGIFDDRDAARGFFALVAQSE